MPARWLLAEGYRLRAAQDELVDMAVAIANELCELDSVATWLESHAVPVE